MLRVEEFENLRGKVVGSDEIFLGSFFLSERTDKGVKLAALRASMAYSIYVIHFLGSQITNAEA